MLWPVKSKGGAEKSPAQQILPIEDADKLFENGHYEECYKLLAEHQVPVSSNILLNSYNIIQYLTKFNLFCDTQTLSNRLIHGYFLCTLYIL